jgi:hypothetical protein
MAKGIQSSLSPTRTQMLPDVYHRPQVGSGVYLLPESINQNCEEPHSRTSNGSVVPNNRVMRFREYENPNVNSMRAFDTRPCFDNFYDVRRLVLAYNHLERRDRPKLAYYRGRYATSLETCNLCWRCKKPIKVQEARFTRPSGIFRKPERKTQYIRTVRGVRLSGERQKTVSNAPVTIYADVQCHFEYRVKLVNGEKKYFFVFVDGTGRNIQSRRNGWRRIFVEVKPDGSETKINYIPQTYRVQHQKCKCPR